MVKTYETLRVEKDTHRRFNRVKHLLEFQNDESYTVSGFIELLLDSIGKGLVNDINRIETHKKPAKG